MSNACLTVLSATANLFDGGQIDCQSSVSTDGADGLSLLSARVCASAPLNPDEGLTLSFDLPGAVSYMALYRRCEYWCRPAFPACLSELPPETQALVFSYPEGDFGLILPLVSDTYKCVLGSDGRRGLIRAFSWVDGLTDCCAPLLIFGRGPDPFALAEKAARVGISILGNRILHRTERHYPDLLEYLGWCSWDAMQIRVDEAGILEKCREFREKGIPVGWALIDDMWGEVRDFYGKSYDSFGEMVGMIHSSRLWDYRADPIRFPRGLGHTVDGIKKFGLRVGVWHPTTGYWKGYDPAGPGAAELGDCLARAADGRLIHGWQRDKAYAYYDRIHGYLRESGADFVKIDNQSMTRRFYRGQTSVGEAARSFHEGMEDSAEKHFGGRVINCMGTASEDMWNRRSSPITRCSGDFMPEDAAWFRKHILQCAYNGLIQGQFYYCDWDMWWTDDGQAEKNSLLRAVSGGPIYISDKLGRSRPELLSPLCLSDGRILRCDRPGMPTADCLTADPTKGGLFKIQNIANGSGIIAVFNLIEPTERGENVNLGDKSGGISAEMSTDGSENVNSAPPIGAGYISPEDVPGLEGEAFGVYEHFSGEFTILKRSERLRLTLTHIDDFRLYILVPLDSEGCGVIGRTDKFISPKTVASAEDGRVILREPGEYAVIENGKMRVKS